MAEFAGFPSGTQDFLRELGADNTRSWFEAHRQDYERFYIDPARQFVLAAGKRLRAIAPGIRAEPRILGSIFRINRDTRFSPDKRPYKDHLDFWFWEGDRKAAVSGFFARVSPDFVGIGAGCHGFGQERMAAFRRALADPVTAGELGKVAVRLTAAGYHLTGEVSPKTRFLYVHVDEPATEATTTTLIETCVRHWRQLAPLHRWLVDRVQTPAPATAG